VPVIVVKKLIAQLLPKADMDVVTLTAAVSFLLEAFAYPSYFRAPSTVLRSRGSLRSNFLMKSLTSEEMLFYAGEWNS